MCFENDAVSVDNNAIKIINIQEISLTALTHLIRRPNFPPTRSLCAAVRPPHAQRVLTRIGRISSRLRAFTHPTVDSSACPPPAARRVRRAVRGSRHDALRALVGDVRMRENVLSHLINDRGASDPHLAVGARRNLVRRVRRYLCVRPISWARSGLARLVLRIGLRTTAL